MSTCEYKGYTTELNQGLRLVDEFGRAGRHQVRPDRIRVPGRRACPLDLRHARAHANLVTAQNFQPTCTPNEFWCMRMVSMMGGAPAGIMPLNMEAPVTLFSFAWA